MSNIVTVTLVLTETQAAKLEDVLSSHQDEGPTPEGWQSKELEGLRETIELQLEIQKGIKR